MDLNIETKYTTKNKCYINNTKFKPAGIILHSVGVPQPKASAFFNSFNTPAVSKAVHAFVQADGYVMQTLPWDVKAWHCGGSCNSTHIGVEMTEPATIKYSGGATWIDNNPAATKEFVLGTYRSAVSLFAYLCKAFNLDPMKDGVILSHHEAHLRGKASGHADVEHIWNKMGLSMNQFRADVKAYMSNGKDPIVVANAAPNPSTSGTLTNSNYLGQVYGVAANDTLNVRNTAGGPNIVGKLKPGTIVNIVGSKGSWLQIRSGGWVAAKYIKKFNNGFNYTPKEYNVTIKADSLNIRSTPEVKNGNVVGKVSKGTKCTIVGECNGFGLLSDGKGNISINSQYVTIK